MTGHAENSVMNYYQNFRSLTREILTENYIVIGVYDFLVQIDECHFGKRKYNREHPVKGGWVLCGIEIRKKKDFFY